MNANEPWVIPASHAQERIWFASQLAGDLPVYRVVTQMRVHYQLPDDVLQRGLATVSQRHESLRTCFRFTDGALSQAIFSQVPVEAGIIDVTGLSEVEQESRLEDLYRDLLTTPLPLDRAPLWRAVFVRGGSRGLTLHFLAHHAIFDGASEVNLRAELTEFYAAAAQDRVAHLPELPVNYADYTLWHRDRLTPGGRLASGRLGELLEYWRKTLAGAPGAHRVPTDHPRPHTRSFRGASVEFPLPGKVADEVAGLARGHGATPFMVLLAAYVALLHRLSKEDDIVVGVPVAGRDLPELQPLIGMFVNMVVLRFDTSGDPTFGQLVEQVRATTLAAWDHQDMPYQKLVETLATRRDPGVPPLYQLGFNHVPGDFDDDAGTAEDDLMLEVASGRGRLQYNTALFERAGAEAMAADFQRCLSLVLADPGMRLSALPVTDRAAVPVPEPAAAANVYVPPRTDAEELVAQVWQEVLGVPRAGAHDDFFELGGHSLLALRVISRLDAITGGDLPIQEFFADTTLAGVAATLERRLTAEIDQLSEEEAAARLRQGGEPS